jgi:pimeloyl-ACP methyl ester carboxylesterase
MPDGRTGLVLVHGAELGSWLWDRLVPQAASPTLAIDLPGRGAHPADRRSVRPGDAVTSVVHDVERWAEADRVVLVAHSFSGVLAPAITRALGSRVVAVVLVGATVPEPGRSWVDLLPLVQRLFLRVLYRIRPDGVLSPEGENRKTLCNDLDEATTRWFLDCRVPEAPGLLLSPVPTAEFPPGLPVHYVRMLDDRTTTDAVRARMISRVPGAVVHDLAGGHLPMLGQPQALADLLDQVALTAGHHPVEP